MGSIMRSLLRRTVRACKRVILIFGALGLMIKDAVEVDLGEIVRHGRLFIGLILTLTGLFSFASDRYCDGNASSYYACTRPATYYYYPWWAIVLVILGSFLIVLWFLRRQHHA